MDIATSRAVGRLASGRCGVARHEQLYELGIERRTLYRRIQQGQWLPVGRRVLVRAGTLLTRSLTAAHAIYPVGTLTGLSAVAADGLLGQDPWNVVSIDPVPWLRADEHRKVQARVIRAKPSRRPRMVHGVPAADRDQVVADLLRYLPFDQARTLLLRLARSAAPRGCPPWSSARWSRSAPAVARGNSENWLLC